MKSIHFMLSLLSSNYFQLFLALLSFPVSHLITCLKYGSLKLVIIASQEISNFTGFEAYIFVCLVACGVPDTLLQHHISHELITPPLGNLSPLSSFVNYA